MANKQYRNKEHLIWVKQRRCTIDNHCSGLVEAHHLLKPFDGSRGMGMKANDKNSIPLCHKHHSLLHTKFGTEANLFKHCGLHEATGMVKAESLWNESPHNPDNPEDDGLPF